jgi:hypothetical protein
VRVELIYADRQIDKRTDMTKVMVAFQEHANASKMIYIRKYAQRIHSPEK